VSTLHDLQALATMPTPEGMSYRGRARKDGDRAIIAHPKSYGTDLSQDARHAYRERHWSPTV